jgi:Sec-independent protein translocase protein TatA
MLWAQAVVPVPKAGAVNPPPINIPQEWVTTLKWLYLWGDPTVTTNDLMGGFLTWLKAMGLICLIGWLSYWLIVGLKERAVGRGRWYDYLVLLAIILTPLFVMLRELESAKRIPVYTIPIVSLGLPAFVALLCIALYVLWIEIAVARTIRRFGRPLDLAVLVLLHVALFAGLAAGVLLQQKGFLNLAAQAQGARLTQAITWREGLIYGARMSATYMGYIVFARVVAFCLVEFAALRGRRLSAIAGLSIAEANRRMWAPWVVVSVFLLVLAFTHWFLQPPRPAEMGRLYVGTLTLLCSVLLTVMVTILTPLSLPTDIQQQTIYTVVSKPVRRLELIWGRMIGYMAIVTVLIVVFGLISLGYLWRTVGYTIREIDTAAAKAEKANPPRLTEAKLLREQADQRRTRMQARVPVKGSLSFLDSRGIPHAMGIDVGQEQSMREPRSHIEGATPSTAIWSFGIVPDPFSPPGRPIPLDRRIPVQEFLKSGTMDAILDKVYELKAQIDSAKILKSQPNVAAARIREIDAALTRNQAELERFLSEYDSLRKRAEDVEAQAAKAESEGNRDQSQQLRREGAKLSSPPLMVEMSFNVYRTTKGKVGEPVYAEVQAINPRTGREYAGDIFPIKEYYTNRVLLPAWILAGSGGALRIEIRCLSPTQYLGMAESDLYLLLPPGNFGVNYMKGLFGVWLQAMVLTAIGVCAGSFLSWPVALLTTIAFFVAGQLAFSFLVDFTRQAIVGGGPFESLIRLLTHDNQLSELTPTAGVVLAKTLDSLVMPLMSLLVYVVPNFQALDVSNMVADGFAVSWSLIGINTLRAVAYALPFSLVGFLILKNREVAA